ncbi:hypothetical protein DAI22_06g222100 [Oryza sativa Japonica Group]|nr:hypothetical protein DAI22_06g222100 [Oryza sativa Japonica Group]KAF2927668.1 hypothetical protein DAI22_06g222100 [Oryza sativa Japonica Group]KAF2927669.1 hypothetical protein DAI22_06g222100 [Oryza sativa Japonica Group]KAF2927670.1 hypothetical protein DAI22_06g222100 [Oryza sativa Japonica Group]
MEKIAIVRIALTVFPLHSPRARTVSPPQSPPPPTPPPPTCLLRSRSLPTTPPPPIAPAGDAAAADAPASDTTAAEYASDPLAWPIPPPAHCQPLPPLPAADSSHRGALIPPLPIAGPSITPPMPRLSPSKTPRLHNPHASRRRLSLTQRNSTNPASPTVPMGRFFTKCARGDIWVLAATSDAELLGLAEIISAASVM